MYAATGQAAASTVLVAFGGLFFGGGFRPFAFICRRLASMTRISPPLTQVIDQVTLTLDNRRVLLVVEGRLGLLIALAVLALNPHQALLALLRRLLVARLALLDLELGHEEAVHVVDVRVEAAREADARVERLPAEARVRGAPELEPGVDELDVRALAQRVVDHRLVLVDSDGAGRVDNVAAGLRVRRDAVERAEDELLLQVCQEGKVALGLREGQLIDLRVSIVNAIPC